MNTIDLLIILALIIVIGDMVLSAHGLSVSACVYKIGNCSLLNGLEEEDAGNKTHKPHEYTPQ